MRATIALAVANLAHAFILPEEQVFSQIALEDHEDSPIQKLPNVEQLSDTIQHGAENAWNGLTDIGERAKSYLDFAVENIESKQHAWEETFDVDSWLQPEAFESEECPEQDEDVSSLYDRPPHHPPHHRRPRHPPHHGKPHHKPNKTVYQLIAESKYTTKLAKLINDFPDVVELLNGTKANFTVFAPTGQPQSSSTMV